MEQNMSSQRELLSKPILNFNTYNEESLVRMSSALSLKLPLDKLRYCQRYFTSVEKRNPFAVELYLLSALSMHLSRSPLYRPLQEMHFEDKADADVWQDICRQQRALERAGTPPTVPVLFGVATAYLRRAGRDISFPTLCADTPEALSAAHRGQAGLSLFLQKGAATLAPRAPRLAGKERRVLLMLQPTEGSDFARDISILLANTLHLGTEALGVVDKAGLFSFLMQHPIGVELDALSLPAYDRESGVDTLLCTCSGTLLFTAPELALQVLLHMGLPLTVIGRVLSDPDRITVRDGTQLLLSVRAPLLSYLLSPTPLAQNVRRTAYLEKTEEAISEVSVAKSEGTLLCGVTAEKDALHAALALVKRLAAEGANFRTATATALVTLPLTEESDLPAESLALLLAYHRFLSETALPAGIIRFCLGDTPRLSLFVAAERKTPKKENFSSLVAAAADALDFKALRRAMYQ